MGLKDKELDRLKSFIIRLGYDFNCIVSSTIMD